VYLEDLLALLPGGTAASVGLPPKCRFSIATEDRGGVFDAVVITVTPTTRLPEGHVYLMQPADVVQALVQDNVPDPTGAIAWRLARTAGAAASAALGRLNFIPLVYVAGAVERPDSMPKPAHAKVTFSGVFGQPTAPLEIWSFSLTFRDLPDHGGTTQALADKASYLFGASVLPVMGSNTALTKTRVAFLGDGAHVNRDQNGTLDQADNLTIRVGTLGGTQYMPIQTALVVSFSSLRQDATGKGRCYLPYQGGTLGGTWQVDPAYAGKCGQAIKDVCDGMENTTEAHVGPHAVMSSKGYASDVTLYRVGLVPDTMRSRRNGLREGYVPATPH
jgi:hypothetical protein